jgi:Peduoviridae DNA primase
MATVTELKAAISCHDLAEKLGLVRPKATGNYSSPHHDDKNPSLSITADGKSFKDYSAGDEDTANGSCIDLYMYVTGCEFKDALKSLEDMYGFESSSSPVTPKSKNKIEFVADKCLEHKERAIDYLVDERKIPKETVEAALKTNSIGFNDWVNPQSKPGEPDYGGEAVSFIVKSINGGKIVSVENRYLNEGVSGLKTKTQGEKSGFPWYMDMQRLKNARTIYVVESPINALSVEACGMFYTSAIAVRAIAAVDQINWSFFHGKQLILAFDNDEPDKFNKSPGREAAYKLYDILVGHNISAMMVDQGEWIEDGYNDLNDILQAHDTTELKKRLQIIEPWVFQGMPGDEKGCYGRPKVFLPAHDYAQYWRYRVKSDFTTFVEKFERAEEDEEGKDKFKFADVAGFRIAAISRVRVASANSVLSGQMDLMPNTLFSVSVQVPRHKAELQRKVFSDEQLHNRDAWNKFGPVYRPMQFSRLINIMERGADLGSRDAINFVGLGWLNEKLVVNEGKDSYFTDPAQQCPYHNLTFPSAPQYQAKSVIKAYASTFTSSAALIPLVWALGAHLKAFLGMYPHLIMQASKGAGKSTFCKRMESTLGMTIFGRETMTSQFRILTSISHTSHPIGWEELSAGKQEQIDAAISALQQSYQYTVTRRGAKMTEFMMCAPVLLTGEDVPVKSLTGKVVRTDLSGKKSTPLPSNLSVFPVKEWLEFLSLCRKDNIEAMYQECNDVMMNKTLASKEDNGASRMTSNYAAVLTAWRLLCDFAGIAPKEIPFTKDLIQEMNLHIKSTDAEREPWVWALEVILSEIDTNRYRHKYAWGDHKIQGVTYQALFIRHMDIINHVRMNTHLRDFWNSFPIKTAGVLKNQMMLAGVVLSDTGEKTINKSRVGRMLILDLKKLEEFGLAPSPSHEDQEEMSYD